MSTSELVPFHTYLWKIASRCNINCSYCYVYNLADQRWQLQPKFMSEEVARRTATRMRDHLQAHGKKNALIIFHGGEPMLGGAEHLRMLTSTAREVFDGTGIGIQFGMQSNALLFTPEIGDLMLEAGITVGVSIDGPPEVNDRHRLDHQGRPTSAELERRLALLFSERYRKLCTGFLCVINPETNPVAVTDYLLSYQPTNIDFLFPLDNHDRLPAGKEEGYLSAAPYGEWLVRSFDHWWQLGRPGVIRVFKSILLMICGCSSLVESIGVDPVDLVVIETNGELEGVDSLKGTFDGATSLGYNVFDHDFDSAARDIRVRSRQMGVTQLCETCRSCPVVEVCGGGYLPHRYSSVNGFDNPSVYCGDLELLIRHIHETLFGSLGTAPSLGELMRDPAGHLVRLSHQSA